METDSYTVFATKASVKLGLKLNKKKSLSLFKLNGTRILDEDVTIRGKLKPWTIGNYLLLIKKSPSNVKLGVGYCTSKLVESSSNSEKVSAHSFIRCVFQTCISIGIC